jgi:hypothetical protein
LLLQRKGKEGFEVGERVFKVEEVGMGAKVDVALTALRGEFKLLLLLAIIQKILSGEKIGTLILHEEIQKQENYVVNSSCSSSLDEKKYRFSFFS